MRTYGPAGRGSRGDVREPDAEAGQDPRRRHPLPRPPVLDGSVGLDGLDPPDELRVPPEDGGAVAHDVRQRLRVALAVSAGTTRAASRPSPPNRYKWCSTECSLTTV